MSTGGKKVCPNISMVWSQGVPTCRVNMGNIHVCTEIHFLGWISLAIFPRKRVSKYILFPIIDLVKLFLSEQMSECIILP